MIKSLLELELPLSDNVRAQLCFCVHTNRQTPFPTHSPSVQPQLEAMWESTPPFSHRGWSKAKACVVGVEVMKKEWNKDDGDKTEMECLFAERSFTVCCRRRRRRSSLQKWQWGRTFRRLLRISYLNGGQQKDQREMGTLSLPASVGPLKREAVASSGRRTEGTPRQMKRNEK